MRLDIPYNPGGGWENNWTLSFPDGRRIVNNGHRTYDRNGNYTDTEWTTFNNHPATRIVDQLGRSITIEYDYATKQDYIYASGRGGEQLKTTVKWKTIYVRKQFRATTVGDPHQRGNEYVQTAENFARWLIRSFFQVKPDRSAIRLVTMLQTPTLTLIPRMGGVR